MVDGVPCGLPLKREVRVDSVINWITRRLSDRDFHKMLKWGLDFKEPNPEELTSVWGEGSVCLKQFANDKPPLVRDLCFHLIAFHSLTSHNVVFNFGTAGAERIKELRNLRPGLFETTVKLADGSEMEQVLLVFALFVDPFCPNESGMYSCTPFVLMLLNLDPAVRTKYHNLFLHTLISGPKKPDDLRHYLELLFEEIRRLQEEGVEVWDAATGKNIKVRAVLLFVIHDSRGWRPVCLQQDPGCLYGCRCCPTEGEYLKKAHKYVYARFRSMVGRLHPLRTDARFGEPERVVCREHTTSVLQQCAATLEKLQGEARAAGKEEPSHERGVEGLPVSEMLGNTFDWGRCYLVDPMHAFPLTGEFSFAPACP